MKINLPNVAKSFKSNEPKVKLNRPSQISILVLDIVHIAIAVFCIFYVFLPQPMGLVAPTYRRAPSTQATAYTGAFPAPGGQVLSHAPPGCIETSDI